MNEKVDNIYIYLWEEFNTIYIGRTKNPKKRHYQHKTRECDKTYKFSSEHHIEHPPMIILESDLTIEEGTEREKYWIEYYRNSSYNVLNKSCGGQKGRQARCKIPTGKTYYQLHREERIEYQKKYREEHNKEKTNKIHKPKTKEELLLQRKEYYQSNRESILIKKKKYRDSHKEELKIKAKEYRKKHKEEIKERRKDYFKNYYQNHKKQSH